MRKNKKIEQFQRKHAPAKAGVGTGSRPELRQNLRVEQGFVIIKTMLQ